MPLIELAQRPNEHALGALLASAGPGRGQNGNKERRAELRKVLQTRIAAMAAKAITKIDVAKVEALTEIARDGLETTTAMAFIDRMPTPAQLMPTFDRAELKLLHEAPGCRRAATAMTDLLAEIRARRLAAEEERRSRRTRADEVAAAQRAAKPPSKAALRRAAREAAARVAGWTGASSACHSLLWSLDYRRCAELCPQQVAPKTRGRLRRRRQAGDRRPRGADRHHRGAVRAGAAGRLAWHRPVTLSRAAPGPGVGRR